MDMNPPLKRCIDHEIHLFQIVVCAEMPATKVTDTLSMRGTVCFHRHMFGGICWQ